MMIEDRLATLERQLSQALAARPVQEVRATAFVLVDAEGREHARLYMAPSESTVDQEDEEGSARVWLDVLRGGPALALLDEMGRPRVGLVVNEDGPTLALFGENGKEYAKLDLSTGNAPGLCLFDESGEPRVGLGTGEGCPRMALQGEYGNVYLGAYIDGPTLSLVDANDEVLWSTP